MKIQSLLLTALLGLAATAAFGATPAPAAGTAAGPHGICAKSPDQCTQLAAKFDTWCQANAQKCTDLKAHIEKRREWCEQNQAKCKAVRERVHERIKERRQEKQGQSSGGNQ